MKLFCALACVVLFDFSIGRVLNFDSLVLALAYEQFAVLVMVDSLLLVYCSYWL